MSSSYRLRFSSEVQSALAAGKPVVALESTIISHGMPYPQNLQTALEVEAEVRQSGAVPATIAILAGVPHIGAMLISYIIFGDARALHNTPET